MKIISNLTENDMIAAFLKAEIESPRFKHMIIQLLRGTDFSFITNPDLSSQKENALRKKVLAQYRGYGVHKLLFSDFPDDVTWKKVSITFDELKKVKYMHYDFWEELSGVPDIQRMLFPL